MKTAVLIPHFNDPFGLEKALGSIHYPKKLDVVIVDDGSKICPDFNALKDKYDSLAIHPILLKENGGIENALNTGLKYILSQNRWEYIARLDCGDVCTAERFTVQEDFLNNNPDVFLLGSWVKFVDKKGNVLFSFKPPTKHYKIKNYMYLSCLFIHPSVMFRTSVIKNVGLYPTDFKAAEDYAFFFKIIKNYKTHIIPKYLVLCEADEKGISVSKRKTQFASKIRIINKYASPNIYYTIGLIKNILLYLAPYKVVLTIKKFILR